jgi:hypothetical protein
VPASRGSLSFSDCCWAIYWSSSGEKAEETVKEVVGKKKDKSKE